MSAKILSKLTPVSGLGNGLPQDAILSKKGILESLTSYKAWSVPRRCAFTSLFLSRPYTCSLRSFLMYTHFLNSHASVRFLVYYAPLSTPIHKVPPPSLSQTVAMANARWLRHIFEHPLLQKDKKKRKSAG